MKRYVWTAIVSFVLSWIFCKITIPLLRKAKAGQNILSYVEEHKKKSGTPTMGGIAFLSAAIIGAIICFRGIDKRLIVCLAIGLAYMAVGVLDDLLKMKRKENLGLRSWQKFFFQLVIALLAGIYCVRAGFTRLYIPFAKKSLDIEWGILPVSVFAFLGAVNGVNLTDGLDGLAAGVSLPFFGALGVVIALQGEGTGLSVVCFSLVGALLAYLLFNAPPASVFMGDTGSLSLGGFAAAISVLTGNTLYLAVLGSCFVFSVISVILQVIYYKATGGKRIFLMAPVHHHFQKKGYSECKISYAYFTVTLLLGLVSIVRML